MSVVQAAEERIIKPSQHWNSLLLDLYNTQTSSMLLVSRFKVNSSSYILPFPLIAVYSHVLCHLFDHTIWLEYFTYMMTTSIIVWRKKNHDIRAPKIQPALLSEGRKPIISEHLKYNQHYCVKEKKTYYSIWNTTSTTVWRKKKHEIRGYKITDVP